MQPAVFSPRIYSVWPFVRRWALVSLIALALPLAGGCAVDGTAEEPRGEPRRAPEPGTAAAAGSRYPGDSSPFPLLVPSFGFDTYDGDCEIGDDPFSACQ